MKNEPCDRCGEDTEDHLKVPYIYLNRNCKKRPDLGLINPYYKDYRQYYVCKKCYDMDIRINKNKQATKKDGYERYDRRLLRKPPGWTYKKDGYKNDK